MRINTNVAALNSQRILGNTTSAVGKNIAKLSSGFRINKAADDAAGLGIANKLRADIRSMKQASRNAEQATSLLQVAEGATGTIQSILERMKELATQSASDNTDSAGRTRIDDEFTALRSEIARIVDTTKYQGGLLLTSSAAANTVSAETIATDALIDGTTSGAAPTGFAFDGAQSGKYSITQIDAATIRLTRDDGQWQDAAAAASSSVVFSDLGVTIDLAAGYTGAGAGGFSANGSDTFTLQVTSASGGNRDFMVSSSEAYTTDDLVSLTGMNLATDAAALDLETSGLDTAVNARAALTKIDVALGKVADAFGKIGAAQNRIEYATANVKTSIENMAAAESTIRDADMAAEMTEFSKNQILQQAGVSMLAQANSSSQLVLKLLG